MIDYKSLDKEYIMGTYSRFETVLVKGKGAAVITEDGNQLIDLTSGIGVNCLGYCNDEWTQAVARQASTLQHTSNLYYSKPCIELAEYLVKATNTSKVFFANSGAEANECAFKIARKYSFDKYGLGRDKILSLVNSFHGRTMATLTATGQDVFHNYFFPFLPSHEYIVANDSKELLKIDLKSTCAIIIELIQGEGGVNALDKKYVKEISDFCQVNDILFIVDEVQTGIGRTGKLLASEHYGIKPDITTLAKGLGGGLPIGACLVGDKCKDVLTFSNHGTTFGGNPVVCAGSLSIMKIVNTPEFLDQVKIKGEYIVSRFSKIAEVESLSGLGMMIGVALKTKNASDVVKECLNRGVMLLTAKTKIRLLPPLNISMEELTCALDIVESVLNKEMK